jgi:hypothetical protein
MLLSLTCLDLDVLTRLGVGQLRSSFAEVHFLPEVKITMKVGPKAKPA